MLNCNKFRKARKRHGIGAEPDGTAQNLQKAPDHLSAAMKAWWADVLASPSTNCTFWRPAARPGTLAKGITFEGRYGPDGVHPARILRQLDLDPPPEPYRGGAHCGVAYVP
jgi:hypothetical protein